MSIVIVLNEKIKKAIRARIIAENTSIKHTSTALGFSHSLLGQYLTGNRNPSPGPAQVIAKWMGVPVYELGEACEKKNKPKNLCHDTEECGVAFVLKLLGD